MTYRARVYQEIKVGANYVLQYKWTAFVWEVDSDFYIEHEFSTWQAAMDYACEAVRWLSR